ncbi:MAG: hypothetical protein AMJ79_06600 [Phycisphaerae bacterium SM23_30]|nr:MAG: hypothetical protein AMJ79_06600 [Phycisphaerae bacterium SM23_30]
MLIENMLNRGSMPVLQQVLQFTEARHELLVNNVTNFDTVGYKVQDLPVAEFCEALQEAVERRETKGAGEALQIKSTKHLHWDREGRLQARPIEIENNNILFHDQNNRFVEKQMSELSKNALLHNVAAELLRQQYGLLQTALRGRM